MADSRQTKIVSYELQGNTTDLMNQLQSAINTLDALDRKLTTISTSARMVGGRDVTNLKRASAISTAETQISKLRNLLDPSKIEYVSPDQLNLLKQANKELDGQLTKLNKFKNAQTISQKALDKTAGTLKDVNKAFKEANITIPKTEAAWTSFINAIHKATATLAIIRMLLSYLNKLYTAASDYIETMNLFNVATQRAKKELYELAEAMQDAYNTDIGVILNSIAVFRQYANTMGFAAAQADIFSEYLTKITYDLASLYNVANADMFNNIKAAIAGQTKPLMKYGISVHRATLEQYALNLGIEKTWTAFSETEKVALRYLAIIDQATLAHGDLAKTIESPSNQLKIAKAQLQVFIRNLGTLVTLISGSVLPVFNGLMISLNGFLEVLAKAAGYEIPDYSDNLSANQLLLDDSAESAEEYADALKGLLAPLDEINQASSTTGNTSGLGDIDPRILEALKGYDNLMDRISTKTDVLASGLENILDPELGAGIGSILGAAFETFGHAVNITTNAIITLAPALRIVTTLLGALLQGTGWLLDHVVSPVLVFVETLTKNIWLLVAAFAALNLAQLAATGNFQSMYAVKIIQWFASLTLKVWANTTALLSNVTATIQSKIAAYALAAALWWETAAWWQKAIAVIAAAGALAAGVAAVVITATTSAKAQADSTMNSNNVPQLASGAVATGPTVAVIGEGRYKEAVIPLENSPQFRSMKDDIANEVLRKIGPTPYNSSGQRLREPQPVIIQLNGREVGRGLLPSIGNVYAQTGVILNK